jgi:bifunctional non-homologous end joining protein LigD
MRPMLATLGREIPAGPGWLHEVKWDGMRVLADVHEGRLRLASRNENDVTASFPELAGLVGAGTDLLLDGEVVALRDGVPSFQALAERMHVQDAARAQRLARTVPVTYMVFDLLRLYAEDLTSRPLRARRELLESLDLGAGAWRVPPVYDDGELLAEAARQQHLEGVVSKRLASRYGPGRRSTDWLKFPVRPSFSFVVGGWRLETDSATRLGALLVGAPTGSGLSYRGKVGAGLAGRAGQTLLEQLEPLASNRSPFCDEVPRPDAKGTTWLRPELVVDVEALGVTDGGRLRQPAYRGLRPDLTAAELPLDGEG